MEVIKQPDIYLKEHECYQCKAVLRIEESDVKLGNFAIAWAGEREDYKAYFVCCVCGSQNVLDCFPVAKLKQMKEKGIECLSAIINLNLRKVY